MKFGIQITVAIDCCKELINQDDLVEALQTKRIRGTGLDVMTPEPLPLDHPLMTMDNV
ncbi:glyoxylate reductase/hydroxypyruvate reductase-like isoform X2, partial [Aphis craccivora]